MYVLNNSLNNFNHLSIMETKIALIALIVYQRRGDTKQTLFVRQTQNNGEREAKMN